MKKILFFTFLPIALLFSYEELTIDTFDNKIKDKNVIIDFYAPWCPPCMVLSDNLKEFEKQKPDNIHLFKVNISDELVLAKKYSVTKLPTLIYFKNGNVIKETVGIKSVEQLMETLNTDFNIEQK